MENVHLVTAWDHIPDTDLAPPVGNRIVRSIQRNHHGAHLSVYVAKDKRNARLVEFDKLSGATLVEPEIEALAVEQRKDIEEEGIVVGKLHLPARLDYQQRRLKTLVLLHQLRDWQSLRGRRGNGRASQRCKPDHNLRSAIHMAAVSSELNLALEFDILRRGRERDKDTGQQQQPPNQPAMCESKHLQNSMPMERLIWLVTLALL